jgi:hypothetical protein
MAASVLSLLHFWFVAYFSLRRGKRSAVSKSMLAVRKLKAPEIVFAACRGPWDDRLIFPDPDNLIRRGRAAARCVKRPKARDTARSVIEQLTGGAKRAAPEEAAPAPANVTATDEG